MADDNTPAREMTLHEVINNLPPRHNARAEFAKMAERANKQRAILEGKPPIVIGEDFGGRTLEEVQKAVYEIFMPAGEPRHPTDTSQPPTDEELKRWVLNAVIAGESPTHMERAVAEVFRLRKESIGLKDENEILTHGDAAATLRRVRDERNSIGNKLSAVLTKCSLLVDHTRKAGPEFVTMSLEQIIEVAPVIEHPDTTNLHSLEQQIARYADEVSEAHVRDSLATILAHHTRLASEAKSVETSVQPEWCRKLPLQQQSVLFLGARGPDGVDKLHACKDVQRAYRACVLMAGKYGRMLEWGEKCDNFMGLDLFGDDSFWAQVVRGFFKTVDSVPHHYYMHLLHGVQILGYKHPDERFQERWRAFYNRGASDLHMRPETEEQMDQRLSDWSREYWGLE